MTNPPKLTDRSALLAHRKRALRRGGSELHELAAIEIEDRLQDINKTFTEALLVGHETEALRQRFPHASYVDDEERLAIERESFDLVIHAFGLHWSDDPIGQMVQCRLALKPDGLFVGVLFGGQTLAELRTVLAETESARTGGISPRVAPLADVRAYGDLLIRAGFALPVADTLRLERRFKSIAGLVQSLRDLGETNALASRLKEPGSQTFWKTAEEKYFQHFTAPDDPSFLVSTFEMVFLTGWAPHESQQKPLRPGTATHKLAEALGVPEFEAGDKVAPRKR